MKRKYIIVSYDVVEDNKRARMARALLNYGRRVQKSVFECLISDREYIKMKRELEKIMDLQKDSVRYYTLCAGCVHTVQVSGWGTVSEKDETIVI